jgi:hypothetical protein
MAEGGVFLRKTEQEGSAAQVALTEVGAAMEVLFLYWADSAPGTKTVEWIMDLKLKLVPLWQALKYPDLVPRIIPQLKILFPPTVLKRIRGAQRRTTTSRGGPETPQCVHNRIVNALQ